MASRARCRASAALLLAAPVATVAAFFGLTILHWGLGDLESTHPNRTGTLDRTLAVASRGLIILGTAFATDPVGSWSPFALLVSQGTIQEGLVGTAGTIGVCGLVAGGLGTTVWAVRRWRAGDRRGASLDVLESVLIVLAIGLTDPLFGIGIYFLGTHSFRHTLTLSGMPGIPGAEGASPPLIRSIGMVHLLSIPLMIPTLIMLLLWCSIQFGGIDAESLTATMLGFFLITTLPHHVLGRRLARRTSG